MKKIIPGVIILLCIYCTALAQNENGINSIKQLTDSIQAIVRQDHIPGLMLGITTKDSILFSGGFGYFIGTNQYRNCTWPLWYI